MIKFIFSWILLTLALSPAFADNNAWIGTWKFDPSKSQLAGETISFSKSADGMYHFSDDSTFSDSFNLDGQERASAFDRSTFWRMAGEKVWDSEIKENGKVFEKKHYELSPDDRTLTVTTTGSKPDGTDFKKVAVFRRVSGSQGMLGRWRSTSLEISSPDVLVLSSPARGILRWNMVADKQVSQGKADGTPHPVTGPTVPHGLTLSFRYQTPSKIAYVFRVNMKPETYGVQTLAADKQSFTDVYWHPGKANEKVSETYVKQ